MDKNNKVKTFFRSALIKMLRFIIRRRYILFEDWNYFSDSPRKIFEELSRRRLSRKYQFVWVSANKLNLGNFPKHLLQIHSLLSTLSAGVRTISVTGFVFYFASSMVFYICKRLYHKLSFLTSHF